mgnify:CR=1 FL=1
MEQGVWIWEIVLVSASYRHDRARAWDAYRSHFPKDKEAAAPGYYTVELSDPQVKAELTASIHAALHRYTYNKADSASLLIDLQHGPAWREEQYHSHVKSCEVNWEDAQTLTGHVNNAVWVNQDYFFVIKFNRPVADSLYLPMGETEKGKRIVATFDIQPGDELMMKVALSTTSVAGAKKNLEAEIPAWDFDGVRDAAHNEWNSYLSRIEIDGTDDEKAKLKATYTFATYWTASTEAKQAIFDQKWTDNGAEKSAAGDSFPVVTGDTYNKQMDIWNNLPAHKTYKDKEGWKEILKLWENNESWDYIDKCWTSKITEKGETTDVLYEWNNMWKEEVAGAWMTDKDWGDKVKARLSDWNTTINKRIETATKQLQDKLVENYNFDKSKFTSDNK